MEGLWGMSGGFVDEDEGFVVLLFWVDDDKGAVALDVDWLFVMPKPKRWKISGSVSSGIISEAVLT